MLLNGRSLVFSYPTVHTQVTSVPAGSTEFNVTVAHTYWNLLGAFVTFRANAAPEGVTDLEHPDTQADGTSFLESQTQIGPLQYPHYPAKDFAEHHQFLQVMAGTYDSTFRNTRLTKNMYKGSSFIAAYPVERVQRMPLSGISTCAGDLAPRLIQGASSRQGAAVLRAHGELPSGHA